MNSFTKIAFVLLLAMVINACQKDNNSNSYKALNNYVVVNEDQSSLNSRVKPTDKIMEVVPALFGAEKSQGIPQKIDLTQNFVFKLRAEVDPPVYEGNTLQATHVRILDHYAFVTYNTRGSTYLGGLDVFDVTDIEHPVIIWNAVFKNADISSVDYFNNKLYIVGAFNLNDDAPKNLKSPAMLEVLSLKSDRKIASVDTIMDLGAYAGTDVRVNGQAIYTTSGTNGGLKIFDHSFKLLSAIQLDNARAVDSNNGKIYVLQGQSGRINVYNAADASLVTTYNVGSANQAEAKSGIVASGKYIFAALNEGGVQMLNLDGTVKQVVPRPLIPTGGDADNYVSNSVSLFNDLVLIANGEAGLYVGGLIQSRNDSLAIMGKVAFDNNESTNFVVANDSVIFVATGLGGLKILSVSIDEGLPPVIIPTTPCPTLYSDILGMFPEDKNNMNANTDLFSPSANKRILLTKESEVYVSFLWEVAGWKNSFGYYTYDSNTPPATRDALDKHIVFPNVSSVGDGGGLHSGDMVRLGSGKFKAGTVIGFYLVSMGWNNGMVTGGRYSLYTDLNLNTNNYQQHLLFINKKCNDIVLTFEDISQSDHLPYQDNDFNDVIFTITDNKEGKAVTSFDLTNMVER
jgi:hypothetical protein